MAGAARRAHQLDNQKSGGLNKKFRSDIAISKLMYVLNWPFGLTMSLWVEVVGR